MAWNGYFEYDGNQIINVARTEQYAKNTGWFHPVYRPKGLSQLLGDGAAYQTPQIDDAPWVDRDDPNTYDFYGVYPLDVTGLEDSSRSSTVVESLSDGGMPGRLRHATKTIVFNTVLIGKTEAAVDAGFQWLKQALLAGPCTNKVTSVCNGAALCYLSSKPDCTPTLITTAGTGSPPVANTPFSNAFGQPYLGQASGSTSTTAGTDSTVTAYYPTTCLDKYRRSLLRVIFNAGPTISAKQQAECGPFVWTVQFTAVAGIPWEFGVEKPVARGFLDPSVPAPILVGTPYNAVGFNVTEQACPVLAYQPVTDPLCPAIVSPPGPPDVKVSCFTLPTSWTRRQFVIPDAFIPLWADSVPWIAIHAVNDDVRNLRIRLYPDPSGAHDPGFDPCAFCGDFVVSFVPRGGTMVIDGSDESIQYVTPDGRSRRADSLVFATDGSPFQWPSMSCGYSYIVTVDTPSTNTVMPYIDLSVFNRVA